MSDFKQYVANLERENAELKNEIAVLKRQLQSANDKAKTAVNGQEFGVPELLLITRQLSHYADLVTLKKPTTSSNTPKILNFHSNQGSNSPALAPAVFKSPSSTVTKNSLQQAKKSS